MPRNVYSEINLHITWHTKQNLPVIRNRIEDRLHQYLQSRVSATREAFLHEVGGVEDHVHLAVSVPPTLCVSNWIGELNGSSSHHINHQVARRKILAWQVGYGVVSFGTKDLSNVVEYIRTQKERHAQGRIHDRLERINRDDDLSPIQRGGSSRREKPVRKRAQNESPSSETSPEGLA